MQKDFKIIITYGKKLLLLQRNIKIIGRVFKK
jgi:hypothetical protein